MRSKCLREEFSYRKKQNNMGDIKRKKKWKESEDARLEFTNF